MSSVTALPRSGWLSVMCRTGRPAWSGYRASIEPFVGDRARSISRGRRVPPALKRMAPSPMLHRDEARAIPVSRPEDHRGGGRAARRAGARRRPRAGRRAEPGAHHGVPAGAAEPPGRHQRRRRARPARGEDGRLCIGAGVRHAAFEKPVDGRPARPAAAEVVASHRAPSDPHPRHVLRQHRARRSGLRMVRGRRRARRRDDGESDARRAPHPRAGVLQGHHDDGAATRTNCWPRCGCRCCGPTCTMRVLPSSAAAPATTPSPWRSRPTG